MKKTNKNNHHKGTCCDMKNQTKHESSSEMKKEIKGQQIQNNKHTPRGNLTSSKSYRPMNVTDNMPQPRIT